MDRKDLNKELNLLARRANDALRRVESSKVEWLHSYAGVIKTMDELPFLRSGASHNPNIEKKNRFKTGWSKVSNEEAMEALTILRQVANNPDLKDRNVLESAAKVRGDFTSKFKDITDDEINDYLLLKKTRTYNSMDNYELSSSQIMELQRIAKEFDVDMEERFEKFISMKNETFDPSDFSDFLTMEEEEMEKYVTERTHFNEAIISDQELFDIGDEAFNLGDGIFDFNDYEERFEMERKLVKEDEDNDDDDELKF